MSNKVIKKLPHGFRRRADLEGFQGAMDNREARTSIIRSRWCKKCNGDIRFVGKQTEAVTQLLAYVANFDDDSVSVVDIFAGEEILAIPVGNSPYDLDISPNRKYLFVSNLNEATLSVISIQDNREVARVNLDQPPFTADQPAGVAVSPDGRFIYVANFGTPNVSIVRNVEWGWKVVGEIPLPSVASEVAITQDGRFAYVTLPDIDRVAVIDLDVNLYVELLTVGDDPEDIAINRNSLALVTNQDDDDLSVINTIIAETAPMTIQVGDFPTGVAFNPEGTIAYVANQGDNTVSVIDIFTHQEIDTIGVGRFPFGVAVAEDGRFIIAANSGDDTISVIDNSTRQVVDTIGVGLSPTYLLVRNITRRVY